MKAMRTIAFSWVLVLMNFFCTGLHAGAEGVSLKLPTPNGEIDVLLSPTGEARIKNYPKVSSAQVAITLFRTPMGFTEISHEACSTIRQKAGKVAHSHLPESMKEQLLSGIRELSSAKLDFKFNDYISQNWLKNEIKRAALNAGIETGSVAILNPLDLTSLQIKVKNGPHSIATILGEDYRLQKQLESLFTPTALYWGEVAQEFSQLDFLCDLFEGNTELTLDIKGEEKNTPVFAQVIPLSEARSLNQYLIENKSQFLKDTSPFSFSRNYMIAGILSERFWKNTRGSDVYLPLWTKMLEQFLDSEKGMPKQLSESELVAHSRFVAKNHSPYASEIRFQTIKPGENE